MESNRKNLPPVLERMTNIQTRMRVAPGSVNKHHPHPQPWGSLLRTYHLGHIKQQYKLQDMTLK